MFGVQTILSALILAAVPAPREATLLFVTTPGCAPCRQFAPMVREIAEMGYSVETVDASRHPELVRDQLQVQQFPTFLMLSHDRIVDRVVPTGSPVNMKPRILKMFEMRDRQNFSTPQQIVQNTAPVVPHASSPTEPLAAKDQRQNPLVPVSFVAASEPPPLTRPEPVPSTAQALPLPQNADRRIRQEPHSCLASSVKLRVDADNTHSWGTGTIIDTRQGEALILTCGHIFRDSKGDGKIEVHLFGENSSVCVFGRCLFYDLEIDLALVAIAPPCPVRAVPIAPSQYGIVPNQCVLSVGCDGGANPTVRTHQIMSTDRIGTPRNNAISFHYVQVSGAPVSGRSGGGLFTEEGYLIGVCNTADPVENDGHFVPPHIIRHVLQKMQLAAVYENPSLVDHSRASRDMSIAAVPASDVQSRLEPLKPLAAANHNIPDNLRESPTIPENSFPSEFAPKEVQAKAVTRNEIHQTTLDEIKRRAQDGDEIIVFIKSRRNPEIPGDVIRLNDDPDPDFNGSHRQQASTSAPENNTIILSSHDTRSVQPEAPRLSSGPQTVSFPVLH